MTNTDEKLDQQIIEFMARSRSREEEIRRGIEALQRALKWVTEDEAAKHSGGAGYIREFLRALAGGYNGKCNIHALMCLLDEKRSMWVRDIFVGAMRCQHPNNMLMAAGFSGNFPDQRALDLINDTDPEFDARTS